MKELLTGQPLTIVNTHEQIVREVATKGPEIAAWEVTVLPYVRRLAAFDVLDRLGLPHNDRFLDRAIEMLRDEAHEVVQSEHLQDVPPQFHHQFIIPKI